MFGAGWTEMLIIGIVALVVIGPKDLPVVMRKIGRVVGTVRRMGGEFQRELSKTTGLDQITDLRRSITEPLRQTSDEIAREFNRQTSTGFEPTGIIRPADPAVESVYDQITATAETPASTMSAAASEPVMPSSTAPEPSPAPPEATEPVPAGVRKTTRKTPRAVAAAEPATPPVKPARARASAGKQKALAALAPQSETATRRKAGARPASGKAATGSAAAKAATPRVRAKKT